MKIVFMGTPIFSAPILEALIKQYQVVAVITQPDKKIGRKQELQFTPVKEVAVKHGIDVYQPTKIRDDFSFLNDIDFDIIITAAYGQIIPKEILDMPKLGCINVHGSLLPKLRGGAPIHRSILNGYSETGITIMYMAEKMDAGDMISQKVVKIEDEDTVGSLHDKLSIAGKELLLETLPSIIDGTNSREVQNENDVTYAWNLKREEEQLDFNMTTREVFNHVRAFNPWPTAYAMIDGKSLKFFTTKEAKCISNANNGEIIEKGKDYFRIKTSDGALDVYEVQYEGKKKMDTRSFLNGVGQTIIEVGKVFNKG